MTNKELPHLRLLASHEGNIVYTDHGQTQMLDRGYFADDVKKILTSATNQLIEVQPVCKDHPNERYVISDPLYRPDTAVIIVLNLHNPTPQIVVITVEPALDSVWQKNVTEDPWLKRVGKMK